MSPHDQIDPISEQIQSYLQHGWLPTPPRGATRPGATQQEINAAWDIDELFAYDNTVTEPDPLPASPTTVTATPPNPISQFADAIAWQMIEQQLPGAVQSSIHRILINPTSADLVHLLTLLQQMGTDLGVMELYAIFGGYRLQAGQSKSPGGTR